MALGIPNKLIVLGILGLAFFVPKRAEGAGTAVRSISESISGSLTALGSTRIEPVFNPSLGFGGNIGEALVGRIFDDPTGIAVPGVEIPAEVPVVVPPPAVPAVEPPVVPAGQEPEPSDEDPYPVV